MAANYTGLRLEPVAALGINMLEGETIHWNASRQFVYPVGEQIRSFHLETNQSQFLFPDRFSANCAEVIKICGMTISHTGQFLAISEVYRPDHGILSIYDTETQIAHVHLRHEQCKTFASLSFSSDASMIAAIGIGKEGTDSRALLWKMGRQVVLLAAFVVSPTVTSLAFDPCDSSRVLLFAPDSISAVQYKTVDKQSKMIAEDGNFAKYAFVPSIGGMILT
jgi:hypothetical protein